MTKNNEANYLNLTTLGKKLTMTPSRIFDILSIQAESYPLKKCLSDKRKGYWESISTQNFFESVNHVSSALIKMGVKPQNKIALISTTNRSEWSILDMSILQVGAVSVPLYPNISSNDYKYILNHSESILCFVSDRQIYDKVFSVKSEINKLNEIYSFDKIEGCKNWIELLEKGKKTFNKAKLEKVKSNVESDSIATIIYTSGTTGVPKGVMLSHGNIVSNVISATKRFPFEKRNQTALSFLPICHIFERTFIYGYLHNSISIYFAESLESISDNLKEVKPNFMTAVPRLLEKVYDKIYAKGNDLKGLKKILFYWSVKIGLKYDPNEKYNFVYKIKHWIAYKLVLSKWKMALGGNLEIICSGSAPLQSRLTRVFSAAGMTIAEAYGLTETSPAISVNDIRDGGLKIGTVGKIIDGVEVVIAADGEVLCKGPNVMKGYYKDPDQTSAVMEGDYFKTGDIGTLDDEGFLKITDRKKQMFKTSGGKYIAPQVIENQLKQSNLIEQIMVVGEGKNMPSALVQPSFEQSKTWLKAQGFNFVDDLESLCKNKALLEKIIEEIRLHDHKFGKWERVKTIRLTPEIWSVEAGHLTPTMKVKRKIVLDKFQYLVDEIYS